MALSARTQDTDPYQIFRYQVFDDTGLTTVSSPTGGFNLVSIPEMNIDIGEYREGLWVYSRKYPLRSHFTQITLHKGVFKNDSKLYQVARATAEGQKYRTDLRIVQYHRSDVAGLSNYATATPSREIRCYNCVCLRYRPSTDLDALGADTSVEEIDFDVESFRLFVNGQEVTVG